MFVSFEGIDGCGKSTQIDLFTKYLESNGINYVKVREPGGTKLGERIRQLLVSEEMISRSELLLFLASRAQLVEEVIKPALKEGKVVVADRFAHSSVAYQGCGRNLGMDVVKMLNDFATNGIYPDLVFYIDIPVELAMLRISKEHRDRIEREGVEFFERVRSCYQQLCRSEESFVLIDGTKDKQSISGEIIRIFEKHYKI
ncbi:thymidylate kinase [Fervidobacterium changbaicum]|uniref:Thymidylate kinase n=2 Tax=Fervidobacterium TaxID=2422 RepID=A0AAI8CLI9_FERIS|nr:MULTISPECIES: dTMP kinase [Fervidobacterium]AMW32666.1 dTMP kinase [Fervidobacterium islandicum]QAV32699.1 dTMP kinase [Fervidobacterium changbaicum]SDH84240.1 thymidylate kinase [Fervidobacterium changbaicum]